VPPALVAVQVKVAPTVSLLGHCCVAT